MKNCRKLESKAQSQLGKKTARNIKPLTDIKLIEEKQKETEEALELLMRRGNPPHFMEYTIFPMN